MHILISAYTDKYIWFWDFWTCICIGNPLLICINTFAGQCNVSGLPEWGRVIIEAVCWSAGCRCSSSAAGNRKRWHHPFPSRLSSDDQERRTDQSADSHVLHRWDRNRHRQHRFRGANNRRVGKVGIQQTTARTPDGAVCYQQTGSALGWMEMMR